jgi:hypothetical protein
LYITLDVVVPQCAQRRRFSAGTRSAAFNSSAIDVLSAMSSDESL